MMLPLAILSFVLSECVMAADMSGVGDISYEDLKQLNVSCHPKDTCAGREADHYPGISFSKSCSCHVQCSLLNTCCIDSPHRDDFSANQECVTVDFPGTYYKSSGYYMVQSCPESSVWKHLCEGGLNKDGDILRIAPISSLDTKTTYKNYYCFRCNELTDNFLYWNLNLVGGTNGPLPVMDDFKLTYNDINNTWSVTAVGEDIPTIVTLEFSIPFNISFPPIQCNPKVISDCPDSWEDDAIRSKCDSYMALLYGTIGSVYRNAHCALCNFQKLDELYCAPTILVPVLRTFSFSHLIDVNRLDGDEVGKKAKCADGQTWDPYRKKCRKLSCALPGYVIKDDKCVAP